MKNIPDPINYSEYLKVHSLVELQERRSEQFGKPCHDEYLFIITHQTYELWFKQIILEVDKIIGLFNKDQIPESDVGSIVAGLERIVKIQKLLVSQVDILETMTPQDFLDFRKYLYPSSGFQSFQFRLIENKLGLKKSERLKYNNKSYKESLEKKETPKVDSSENQKSLFDLVEQWLERTPILFEENFNFWEHYQAAVKKMFEDEIKVSKQIHNADPESEKKIIEQLKEAKNTFENFFDDKKYEEMKKDSRWRLSNRAIKSALLIQLYRSQPLFQLPFKLMTLLIDVDNQLTSWRYRHALMVQRMLGSKMGTGGSSGFSYLLKTLEHHKVFNDFANLSTFLIPTSDLPVIPKNISDKLGFFWRG